MDANTKTDAYDVIILGAGAAGLMCAKTAAARGLKVLLLEKANKPGKKILMSGGGRCNFTNMHCAPDYFLSANPHFMKSALSRYSQWDFIQWVEDHDIGYHEKELGQLFCNRSAKDLLNALLDDCREQGVDLHCDVSIEQLAIGQPVTVKTNIGQFTAPQLVVATGGLSIPKMGGSDYGYQLAEQMGLTVLPKRAGLVPLMFSDQHQKLFSDLSGSSVQAEVSAENAQSFTHQVLFTHRGLSGPAILQISSYWQPGESIYINLIPDYDFLANLIEAKLNTPQLSMLQVLQRFLPKRLAETLGKFISGDDLQRELQTFNQKQLAGLAESYTNWVLKPAASEGYRTAEVTLGGVDTNHLSSKTMAVKSHPNIYFIGEVVDVTGHLGGFNFQWAWSSGFVAGMSLKS
ncbi:BaiN/RdsA family NAD(P)/FAD-dependent oxidoreductase [Marinicella gelatinilytica]|uniref:NAD(P)/FAD-dependent oxidoreductase n=1 Tax=Marinicella gelatinilytica TaxID=2996017 RepID=UPI002260CAFA|nr:NAD(P)/FAD-dependent oxidoreductase [Marinicella gelatinilytica]MCX7543809.1 NAD(P)/FAD-dependent oxidoreductase [Marinicella gelatinilytica]